MAILSVPSDLLTGDRQGVSLAAGIALTVVGVLFVLMELRARHMPQTAHDGATSKLTFREGVIYLATGGLMAGVDGGVVRRRIFEPATEALGIPTAFAWRS